MAALTLEMFAIRSEEAGRLRQSIQRLPPQYRIILVLRDMRGRRMRKVVISEGRRRTLYVSVLHRARSFVRKELMKRVETARRREDLEVVTSRHREVQTPAV